MYTNVRRPSNRDVKLDFQATDIKTGNTIFVDHKGMIDFQSLADQGKDLSKFPSHETVAQSPNNILGVIVNFGTTLFFRNAVRI